MALNKNALIRYKTIDKCLQNSNRRWTLDDLIEACTEPLSLAVKLPLPVHSAGWLQICLKRMR